MSRASYVLGKRDSILAEVVARLEEHGLEVREGRMLFRVDDTSVVHRQSFDAPARVVSDDCEWVIEMTLSFSDHPVWVTVKSFQMIGEQGVSCDIENAARDASRLFLKALGPET